MVGLAGGQDFGARRYHPGILDRGLALRADTERHSHIPRAPFRHTDARNLEILVDIGERVLVFLFHAEEQFAIGIERPGIRFFFILLLRDTPDLGGVGNPVTAATSFRKPIDAYAFVVDGKAYGFNE